MWSFHPLYTDLHVKLNKKEVTNIPYHNAGFEVLTAAVRKSSVFWATMTCSLLIEEHVSIFRLSE
jgi:hypothetical protein